MGRNGRMPSEPPKHQGGRGAPPPPPRVGRPSSCPLELVTVVPVMIVWLLLQAAWCRVKP